jgi:hypothetical protein
LPVHPLKNDAFARRTVIPFCSLRTIADLPLFPEFPSFPLGAIR